MPGLVVRSAAFTAASSIAPISAATRSGVHKQGPITLTTTGHTGHHVVEVTSDSAQGLVFPDGFWHWMNNPLAAGRVLIDRTLVMPDGELVPVTWNGETTLDVTFDGSTVPAIVWPDVIDREVLRGEKPAIRTWARSAIGTCELGASWYSDTGTESWFQTGNHVNDATNPPVIGGSPAYNNTYYAHPLGLFAHEVSDRASSIFGWGDSNFANSDQFTYHERSYAKRFPYFRCCSAGQGLASGASANVIELARGYAYADIAMGTNNLGQNLATNLPMLTAAIANFRASGIGKILVCTLPPSTTSDEGDWSTYSGQHPFGGSAAQWQNSRDLNNAIRAMAAAPGGGNGDGVFDAQSYVQVETSAPYVFSVADTAGLWKFGTAPGIGTAGTFGTGPHFEDRGMANTAPGHAIALGRIMGGETGFNQQSPALGT